MSKSRAPFTWAVWWRISVGGRTSSWHDKPRLYRSEFAADMAIVNLTTLIHSRNMQYVALPIGVHPDLLGEIPPLKQRCMVIDL